MATILKPDFLSRFTRGSRKKRRDSIFIIKNKRNIDHALIDLSLENLYENCPIHSTEYSKQIYHDDFKENFDDDYKISLAMQTGDVYFPEAMESGFLLGPKDGPAYKIPESIEVIRKGAKISFPSNQSLVLTEDLQPGDYHVKVRSTGETLLSYNNDIEFGEVDVVRHYAASNGARGSLSISYYMNTGNIHSFFDITGLINKEIYPQVHEGKITGSLGDYKFNDAYIREMSFNARPYQAIETNIQIDIFGTLDYEEGISEDLINNGYYCTRQEQITVPHAVGTKIEGIENMTGKIFPADFKLKSIEGSSEIDLVRSGLEDTMLETYKVISDVWNKHSEIPDLRTAAMIVAVKRIAQSYNSLGI